MLIADHERPVAEVGAHQAAAGECHEVGLPGTPVRQSEDGGQQEVAVLDLIVIPGAQQPLRAAEPAACACRLALLSVCGADPERAAEGGERVIGVDVRAMSTLEQREVLRLAPEHVGRDGQELDIRGA